MANRVACADYFGAVKDALDEVDFEAVDLARVILADAKQNRNTVWIVGNGGSASTASHFANDLVKMAGIRAISVPDATPAVLAYGNDFSWRFMFSRYILQFVDEGDVLVAISCSGGSENVLDSANAFRNWGKTIVLTGKPGDGNELSRFDQGAVIYVPVSDIRIQEDVHLAVCHAIAGVLRDTA